MSPCVLVDVSDIDCQGSAQTEFHGSVHTHYAKTQIRELVRETVHIKLFLYKHQIKGQRSGAFEKCYRILDKTKVTEWVRGTK